MSGDIFLKLNGVEGESKDSKHPNEIQLETVSWGASNAASFNYGGGGGSLAQEQGSLSFTKIEFVYKMQGQDGKLQGQVRADWDVKANKGTT